MGGGHSRGLCFAGKMPANASGLAHSPSTPRIASRLGASPAEGAAVRGGGSGFDTGVVVSQRGRGQVDYCAVTVEARGVKHGDNINSRKISTISDIVLSLRTPRGIKKKQERSDLGGENLKKTGSVGTKPVHTSKIKQQKLRANKKKVLGFDPPGPRGLRRSVHCPRHPTQGRPPGRRSSEPGILPGSSMTGGGFQKGNERSDPTPNLVPPVPKPRSSSQPNPRTFPLPGSTSPIPHPNPTQTLNQGFMMRLR